MLVDSCRAWIWYSGTTFISRWFSSDGKSVAYGVIFAAAALFSIGMVLAARLSITTSSEYGTRNMWFVLALLITAVVVFLLALFLFRDRPSHPPGPQSDSTARATANGVAVRDQKRADRDKHCCAWFLDMDWGPNRAHSIVYFAAYLAGVVGTWSLSSLMLQIANDHGYTNSQLTWLAIIYIICSLPTPIVAGVIMDVTKDYRSVVLGIVGLTTGSFLMFILSVNHIIPLEIAVGLTAFFTGSYSVSFSECVTELAFPAKERYITMNMFFYAQLCGAVGTILASSASFTTTALWVYFGLYVASFIALAVDRFFPVTYHRVEQARGAIKYQTLSLEDRTAPLPLTSSWHIQHITGDRISE
jgi:MFS family permease